MTPQYEFHLVTTDKPKEWSLHEIIKQHFRMYPAPNLYAALRELAENLMSEFGLVENYTIQHLGQAAWQITIGKILIVKFSWSWHGFI